MTDFVPDEAVFWGVVFVVAGVALLVAAKTGLARLNDRQEGE